MAVGPVASGKSTLVSGIFGLVRQVAEAGQVRIWVLLIGAKSLRFRV